MAAIESVPIIDWAVALHHPQVRSFGRVYTLSTLQIWQESLLQSNPSMFISMPTTSIFTSVAVLGLRRFPSVGAYHRTWGMQVSMESNRLRLSPTVTSYPSLDIRQKSTRSGT